MWADEPKLGDVGTWDIFGPQKSRGLKFVLPLVKCGVDCDEHFPSMFDGFLNLDDPNYGADDHHVWDDQPFLAMPLFRGLEVNSLALPRSFNLQVGRDVKFSEACCIIDFSASLTDVHTIF